MADVGTATLNIGQDKHLEEEIPRKFSFHSSKDKITHYVHYSFVSQVNVVKVLLYHHVMTNRPTLEVILL